MEKEIILSTIPEALEDVKAGKIIIVVDDEDRENEGDFMLAAEMATPEKINFMMRYGRGVLCAPMSDSWADKLNLPLQVVENTSLHETPFTVTVDYLHKGVTTGVSMYDRATTIQALADPMAVAVDFARPGHINPLRAKEKGVVRRAGHTEACVDLVKMAGFKPVAALIEVVQENGEMARLPQLAELAKQFDIKIISIADLIKYRMADDALVERGVEAKLPTQHGEFRIIPFKQISNGLEHVALIKGDVTTGDEAPLVRVHSSCLTGDVFGSCRCDCGEQLHKAMEMVQTEGRGAIIYLNQEGRGIGLMSKIASYKLQQEGLDTVEANVHLGYAPDERDYGVGAAMLREIGITRMRLLTNNPVKRVGLESYGLEIVENIPLEITPNKHDAQYLKTKKEKMGHTLKNV